MFLVGGAGLAVGFCAVGAVSIGVFSFEGVAFGILAAGAICYVWLAMGAISVGVHALFTLSDSLGERPG